MTAINFGACFAETEKWEGWHQFSYNPHDPGGATYCGLTQRAYDAWRVKKGRPFQGVRKAGDDEIKEIFFEEFWTPARCADCFSGLDLMVFDIAINSGLVEAVKILQRAIGLKVDGWFGLETVGAIQHEQNKADLLYRVHVGRLGFWRGLPIFRWFGRGWTSREDDVYAHAKGMLQ